MPKVRDDRSENIRSDTQNMYVYRQWLAVPGANGIVSSEPLLPVCAKKRDRISSPASPSREA